MRIDRMVIDNTDEFKRLLYGNCDGIFKRTCGEYMLDQTFYQQPGIFPLVLENAVIEDGVLHHGNVSPELR